MYNPLLYCIYGLHKTKITQTMAQHMPGIRFNLAHVTYHTTASTLNKETPHMKTCHSLSPLLFLVTVLMTACDHKTNTQPPSSLKTPEQSNDHTKNAGKPAKEFKFVTVSKEGSKFEPTVAKDKIPGNAYYCDMGTVHYARMDRGDGKCPVCGMMLTQKPKPVVQDAL